LNTLEAMDRDERRNQIRTYYRTPENRALYPKQMQFFRLGRDYNERGLFGGNRSGKTIAGGFETTLHLTGNYPDWWEGKRFTDPVSAWASGDTAKGVRDIIQSLMVGAPGDASALGSGLIPADLLLRTTVKHGVADAIETVYVRHVPTGGVSSLQFKSYDQGRAAFQGTSNPWIWLDEEPPEDVYTECLLRTMTVDGSLILTATPLQGLTALMLQYLPELAPTPEPAL
jgi:phage terminase large subunit-like protein